MYWQKQIVQNSLSRVAEAPSKRLYELLLSDLLDESCRAIFPGREEWEKRFRKIDIRDRVDLAGAKVRDVRETSPKLERVDRSTDSSLLMTISISIDSGSLDIERHWTFALTKTQVEVRKRL